MKNINKKIKNVHLSIHPLAGRVCLSVPENMERETISLFPYLISHGSRPNIKSLVSKTDKLSGLGNAWSLKL